MNKKIIKTIVVLLSVSVWYFLPVTSLAANIYFGPPKGSLTPGGDFLVPVLIDTKDLSINALEGTILFPPSALDLKEVRDGNSSISLWVEKPHETTPGSIVFSGTTPGGLTGSGNFLFSLVFHGKQEGDDLLEFRNLQALQNDGKGTKALVDGQQVSLSVSTKNPVGDPNELVINDKDRPETFKPSISRDPKIFNDQYFLVFTTQDKGVGIDHYEVKEGYFGKFNKAESPYLLKSQWLVKNIYVKVVDKNKNQRIVTVGAPRPLWPYAIIIIGGIIVISILISKKRWLKFIKK